MGGGIGPKITIAKSNRRTVENDEVGLGHQSVAHKIGQLRGRGRDETKKGKKEDSMPGTPRNTSTPKKKINRVTKKTQRKGGPATY